MTFIILARPSHLSSATHPNLAPSQVEGCRMVGDVNLFLPNGSDGDGECEIMIACEFPLPDV